LDKNKSECLGLANRDLPRTRQSSIIRLSGDSLSYLALECVLFTRTIEIFVMGSIRLAALRLD
jgi:hypothetical protein